MLTAAVEAWFRAGSDSGFLASTDPVDPIRDYTIPIPPFKQPPSAQDFERIRRRQRRHDPDEDHPQQPPQEDGHVDEYA